MNISDTFRMIVDRASGYRREGLPKPEGVAKRGILTRESIAYQEARAPKDPALEHDIDDASLRTDSAREIDQDHKDRIATLKGRFERRSAKGRADFRTAGERHERDYER